MLVPQLCKYTSMPVVRVCYYSTCQPVVQCYTSTVVASAICHARFATLWPCCGIIAGEHRSSMQGGIAGSVSGWQQWMILYKWVDSIIPQLFHWSFGAVIFHQITFLMCYWSLIFPGKTLRQGKQNIDAKGTYIHSQSLKSKFEQKISQACCLFVRFYELEKGPKAVYRRLERYNYSVSWR